MAEKKQIVFYYTQKRTFNLKLRSHYYGVRGFLSFLQKLVFYLSILNAIA